MERLLRTCKNLVRRTEAELRGEQFDVRGLRSILCRNTSPTRGLGAPEP